MTNIPAGTLMLFLRRTWRDVHSFADFAGWLSNWIICISQRLFCRGAMGDFDGLWECPHAALVVMGPGFEPCCLESTASAGGVRLSNLDKRMREYQPGILFIPLNELYHARWSNERYNLWMIANGAARYRWGGLVFALMFAWIAWRYRGYMFCSELVLNVYQAMDIVPERLAGIRGNKVVMVRLKSECFSPTECGALPQLARNGMYIFNGGFYDGPLNAKGLTRLACPAG
jgi:hypothetical protein